MPTIIQSNKREVIVSNHAVIRYLQRIYDFDIDTLKEGLRSQGKLEDEMTDSCILQYLEHKYNVDTYKLRELICPEELKSRIKVLGSGQYEYNDAVVIVRKKKDIDNKYIVVTILDRK